MLTFPFFVGHKFSAQKFILRLSSFFLIIIIIDKIIGCRFIFRVLRLLFFRPKLSQFSKLHTEKMNHEYELFKVNF